MQPRVPMRDGAAPSAELFRPSGSGHFPTIHTQLKIFAIGKMSGARRKNGRCVAPSSLLYILQEWVIGTARAAA